MCDPRPLHVMCDPRPPMCDPRPPVCDVLYLPTQGMRDVGRRTSPDIRQIDLDVLRTFRDHIMYCERYGIKLVPLADCCYYGYCNQILKGNSPSSMSLLLTPCTIRYVVHHGSVLLLSWLLFFPCRVWVTVKE